MPVLSGLNISLRAATSRSIGGNLSQQISFSILRSCTMWVNHLVHCRPQQWIKQWSECGVCWYWPLFYLCTRLPCEQAYIDMSIRNVAQFFKAPEANNRNSVHGWVKDMPSCVQKSSLLTLFVFVRSFAKICVMEPAEWSRAMIECRCAHLSHHQPCCSLLYYRAGGLLECSSLLWVRLLLWGRTLRRGCVLR